MSETSALPALAPRTWLRQWRDRTAATQEDAAAAVGISRNRWSEIEGGETCLLPLAHRIEELTGIASKDWHRTDDYPAVDALPDNGAATVAAE